LNERFERGGPFDAQDTYQSSRTPKERSVSLLLDEFAPNFHQAVRDAVERTRAGNEQETATFSTTVESVKKLLLTITERIEETEDRPKVIRRLLDEYFRG